MGDEPEGARATHDGDGDIRVRVRSREHPRLVRERQHDDDSGLLDKSIRRGHDARHGVERPRREGVGNSKRGGRRELRDAFDKEAVDRCQQGQGHRSNNRPSDHGLVRLLVHSCERSEKRPLVPSLQSPHVGRMHAALA